MDALDPGAWSEFGTAMVGAAATLARLVFVANSIKLRGILSVPWLAGRAGEELLTLVPGRPSTRTTAGRLTGK